MSESRHGYIDVLRGLAALQVTASHAGIPLFYNSGAIGVWLFFVLSGFLLAKPFVANPGLFWSRDVLWSYFVRRMARILPMYWVMCVFFALFIFEHQNPELKRLVKLMVFAETYEHLWSVRQEVVFYLFIPFLAASAALFGKRLTLWFCAVTITALALERLFFWTYYQGKFPFTTEPLYVAPLMIGVGAAALNLTSLGGKISRWGIPCLIVCTFATRRTFEQIFNFFGESLPQNPTGAYPAVYALFFVPVVLAAAKAPFKSGRLEFLRHLGKIGYSFYLWHWFFLVVGLRVGLSEGTLLFLFMLVTSWVASLLTFHWVESPFIKWASQSPKDRARS